MSIVEGHFYEAIKRPLPRLKAAKPHDRTLVVVGGGPSLEDDPPVEGSGDIVVINHVHGWLLDRGIVPKFAAYYEALVDPAEMGVVPDKRITYWVGSLCSPYIFDYFKDCKVIMWHPYLTRATVEVAKQEKTPVVGAGFTTSCRCMQIGHVLGYRKFILHGMDSSYRKKTHTYRDAPSIDAETITFNGKTYRTHYRRQAEDVIKFRKAHPECGIMVRGSGLLPDMIRSLTHG